MSLNWNVGKCKGFKKTGHTEDGKDTFAVHDVDGKEIPWAVTNALIWSTMGLFLGGITEKNVVEFATRLSIYQRVFGASLTVKGEPRFISTQEVKAHIGLETNVSDESRAAFLKYIGLV